MSSATAAKPVTRATAEKALREFLARVERVNRDARILGRVNRVVLLGSRLREDADRLSDLDLAVEVLPRTADREKLEAKNLRRIESLARAGQVFRDIFDIHLHWRWELSIPEEPQPDDFVGRLYRREIVHYERPTSHAAW